MEEHATLKKLKSGLKCHFNLKQMRDKEKLAQIILTMTVNKQRLRVYTHLRVQPKYWDKGSNCCCLNMAVSLREKNKLVYINKQLKRIINNICQVDEKLALRGKFLSFNILQKITKEIQENETDKLSPLQYLHKQVNNYSNSINRKGKRGIASTQKTYFTALNRLEKFCKENNCSISSFDDFDKPFFEKFSHYLYTYSFHKGKNKRQYTQNTIVNTLKVIKNLLHRAYDNEMTENNSFQKVQTTLSAEASEQIYLSEKDITKIAKVMTNNREESEIRDMFVVACYTALRFSDIQLLNKATIQNGSITLYQEKTKELVEIPILKEIVSLINHYQQYGFPSFTSCKANQVIRELAKRSGINELITYKECRGGISYIIQKPKWERISFHTARRSCITNLYKRGYPINYIMSLSGHRSMQAFQRYMRASSKEIASNFMDYLKKEDAVL